MKGSKNEKLSLVSRRAESSAQTYNRLGGRGTATIPRGPTVWRTSSELRQRTGYLLRCHFLTINSAVKIQSKSFRPYTGTRDTTPGQIREACAGSEWAR